MDIPLEPEAIQEEEELIEAVEALVKTGADTVKQSLVEDWRDLQEKVTSALEWAFPILGEYRLHTRRASDDLRSLAFASLLFVVSFLVLAPSGSWRRKVQAQSNAARRGGRSKFFKSSTTAFSGGATTTGGGGGTSASSSSPRSDSYHSSTTSDEDESGVGGGSGVGGAAWSDGDETDEERFEKLFPGISESPYRLLVLPPACRRVERTPLLMGGPSRQSSLPRRRGGDGDHQDKDRLSHRGASSMGLSSTTAAHELLRRSDSASTVNNGPDDNPAKRLQFYLSHLLFLLKKIVSYDYAGAGWTLWQWFHGYIRRRRIAQTKSTNDESSAVTAAGFVVKADKDAIANRLPPALSTSNFLESSTLQPPVPTQGKHRPLSIPESPGASSEMDPDESDYYGDCDGPIKTMPSRVLPLHALLEEEKKGDDDTASRSPLRAAVDRGMTIVPQRTVPAALASTHRRQSSDSTVYHDLDRDSVSITSPSPRSHHKLVKKNLLKRISISLRKREDSDSSLQELDQERSFVQHAGPPQPCEEPSGLVDKSPLLAGTAQHASSPTAAAVSPVRPQPIKSADSAYFFETAASHESLKKISIDVPVPDRNGYVLGDDFLPDSRYTPLLVFVNSRAGPQQGHLLITQLRRLLNPIQVWDLADGAPDDVLESFLVFTRLRILVCGGDGTVSWIVSVLEGMKKKIRPKKWPPIAILPLGTGNDLARIHGWGGGYNNESLITILEQISESYISLLDIWEVTVDLKHSKKKEVKTFFNYLGVGADAQAALQVHYLRESRPDWFFSRVVNKLWYGVFGAEDLLLSSSVNVRKEIKLLADGVEVSIPPDSQGIIILNIDSYAGGVPLWSHGTKGRSVTVRPLKSPRRSQSMNTLSRQSNLMERVDSMDDMQMLFSEEERIERVMACDMESSCQDGILEIVSIRGAFHLGQIKVGLSNAQRLCQCREAVITIKNNVPVQVDGEPWRQRPCTLTVRRKQAQAVMLHRSADDGGVETEMSKLLDWAEERQIIDSEIHSILMKEYSRRIESKTRRRRVREQDNIMHTLKKAISQSAIGTNLQASHNWQGGISF